MKHFTSQEVKKLRKDFRTFQNHKELPEVSLIADKDSTALFNVAGMQPLIPYLMGKEHPMGQRLFDIQKCVRTVDIAEVGDRSHLTFFEMMGNWSLGDYFKKEAVTRSWEFLTKYLELDPRKLAVTVFAGNEFAPKDEETSGYWQEAGIPEERISYLSDNWRSPGPVGPCGPDTEIFYRVGESEFPPEGSNVGTDEDHWMEIWNNVFMEFYKDDKWILSKLKKQNVDTWMGFERICKVLQEVDTVYETDLFTPALEVIEKYTRFKYQDDEKRFRIIADHSRTAFMLINDGLIPSNVGAGYVLRMIIRRMVYRIYFLQQFSLNEYKTFFDALLNAFSWLRNFNKEEILRVLLDEVKLFIKTIQNGIGIIGNIIHNLKKENKNLISWEDVFKLYDTYGFPLELTQEIAENSDMTIDEKGYEKCIQKAKERSRNATKEMFKKGTDWSKYLEGIPQTQFVGYSEFETSDSKLLKDFEVEGQRVLIFDKTPFYAEMGGQKGDFGKVILDSGEEVEIKDVQTFAGVSLHLVK